MMIITSNELNVPVVLVKGNGTTPNPALQKKGKEKNVSFHPQKSEKHLSRSSTFQLFHLLSPQPHI